MNYENVYIESINYSIPDEIVTSDEIEARLEPLYTRLRLPEGRLELMTGIRERRFWAGRHVAWRKEYRDGRKSYPAIGHRSQVASVHWYMVLYAETTSSRPPRPVFTMASGSIKTACSTTFPMPAWAC